MRQYQVLPKRISASTVLLHKISYCGAVSGKCADSRLFIIIHEAAVTFDIGTKNGGEFAFKTFVGHRITPFVMAINRLKNWDKNYSEECEMKSEARLVLTDDKSLQVRWNRNSKFIDVYV